VEGSVERKVECYVRVGGEMRICAVVMLDAGRCTLILLCWSFEGEITLGAWSYSGVLRLWEGKARSIVYPH
jgi:hypothetical protein